MTRWGTIADVQREWQVGRNADRGRQLSGRIEIQRIGVDHLQATRVSPCDLIKRGQAAAVFLDGQHAPRTFGQEATG